MDCDALVVGAGLSGLVAACELADAGKQAGCEAFRRDDRAKRGADHFGGRRLNKRTQPESFESRNVFRRFQRFGCQRKTENDGCDFRLSEQSDCLTDVGNFTRQPKAARIGCFQQFAGNRGVSLNKFSHLLDWRFRIRKDPQNLHRDRWQRGQS